jgi:hypothetical protein
VNYSPPTEVNWAVPLIKHNKICDRRTDSRIQLSKPNRTCSTSLARVLRPHVLWSEAIPVRSAVTQWLSEHPFTKHVRGFVSCNPVQYQAVLVFNFLTRLIIGLGSCRTRLSFRVNRVDMNPTRRPELPTLGVDDAVLSATTHRKACLGQEGQSPYKG